ncbi:uncharacterized protein Z519_02565 [Cladophialophora bantiana CBS 173.52]|uniref:Zn(2)-C6 fungal-type domain-containing protein n=1 Tax=Cladophialophora bantiana (strain ATCC 10958 / CBS 173.52 / CDC B-1940 / NIH 8579) TaxID=1442370 RepID=A0A0D2HUX9_CLAB1|nr:uncharacterized protein Z519_02565 [Cladophialophora bantiana CBS 173.52]KIW97173.1 hypothetical protein Z519_02565 [Cladophialophora bantiana CBS 173.52]
MDRRQLQSLLPSSSGSNNTNHSAGSSRSGRAERLVRNRITRVGTACESCKRRRSKAGIQCTFDPSLDGRRAGHREDREALALQNRLLTALLQVVRFRSTAQVEAVIKCIREDDPTHDIFATIQDCLQQLDEGEPVASSGVDGLQSDFQPQLPATSSAEESEKVGSADVVCLGRDTSGKEATYETSTPPSHGDGEDENQPNNRPDGKICPTCNQPSLAATDALTPPESAHEHLGHSVPDEQYAHGTDLHSGKAHHSCGATPPNTTTSSSRWQSNVGDLQQNRQGWHFTLCAPGTHSAHPTRAVAVNQVEERAPKTDASYQLVAQYAAQDISPSTTSVESPNTRGASYSHVSPLYGIQTLIMKEKTPLSDIITGFMDNAQALLSYGVSPSSVLGSDVIDVELFFRDRTREDEFTVCSWACEVWRSFHDWDVYVRLAQILAYATVMRWMLVPTAQSYAAIPAILKPRPIQYLVPHHIALDFLPLPPLREALIKNLRDWMTALPAAPLSVNWVRGMDTAVVWDDQRRRRLLSREFVQHITNYQNWSVGESILDTFPEVEGLIRLDRK